MKHYLKLENQKDTSFQGGQKSQFLQNSMIDVTSKVNQSQFTDDLFSEYIPVGLSPSLMKPYQMLRRRHQKSIQSRNEGISFLDSRIDNIMLQGRTDEGFARAIGGMVIPITTAQPTREGFNKYDSQD